eukprot:CAMPEP_0113682570 /NCGR_PEP_ID=MMETSP0038_2-20120614/12753_1 /TAXON_ID=2898 /ORGANISM="Cryptomonas paramecium" /LENGTH=146 /DNA_ID=CAMNT_0000601687 /DNA_START=71 /DNA_END=509 /DNA_ORIENTATION=- /assembly_acc=CAM_ASM_000170
MRDPETTAAGVRVRRKPTILTLLYPLPKILPYRVLFDNGDIFPQRVTFMPRASSALRDSSLTETVLELARKSFQISAAASAGGPAALGLGAPVIFAKTSRGVRARAAGSLLQVEGTLPAAAACNVGLVVALTKAGCTLTYHHCRSW